MTPMRAPAWTTQTAGCPDGPDANGIWVLPLSAHLDVPMRPDAPGCARMRPDARMWVSKRWAGPDAQMPRCPISDFRFK